MERPAGTPEISEFLQDLGWRGALRWGSGGTDPYWSEASDPPPAGNGKSSAQVGLGCRDLGALGILAWKHGGWRRRSPGRGRREGVLVIHPHPHAARCEETPLAHSIGYQGVVCLASTVSRCGGTSYPSRRPVA